MTHDDRNQHAGDGEGEPVVERDPAGAVDDGAPAGTLPTEAPDAGPTETGAENGDGPDLDPPVSDPPVSDPPVSDAPVSDPRVEALAAEVAERTADLQRISAEYANYRRRVDRDRESVLVGARVSFVSELLTVLDDIERAESHGDLTGPFKSVADKIVAAAQKQGLEPFGFDGESFDPALHEAVQHESTEATGPTVTVVSTVLRRGYRIADRVLRPAMVTVTDRAPEPSDITSEQ